jgi:hypothetical protein
VVSHILPTLNETATGYRYKTRNINVDRWPCAGLSAAVSTGGLQMDAVAPLDISVTGGGFGITPRRVAGGYATSVRLGGSRCVEESSAGKGRICGVGRPRRYCTESR